MSLEIYQSAFTADELESAIAGGRAPWADGLTEFPLEAYTVRGADLRSIGNTVAQKAEVEAPAWPEGFQSAANMFVKVYFTPTGVGYVPDTLLPTQTALPGSLFASAVNLRSLSAPEALAPNAAGQLVRVCENCAALRSAYFPKAAYVGHYNFSNCAALETVQLGSAGHPVATIGSLCFYNCTQPALTVTVYVDASTLAEISESVIGNAPWGATNATIIYRNSVTGEVITE